MYIYIYIYMYAYDEDYTQSIFQVVLAAESAKRYDLYMLCGQGIYWEVLVCLLQQPLMITVVGYSSVYSFLEFGLSWLHKAFHHRFARLSLSSKRSMQACRARKT